MATTQCASRSSQSPGGPGIKLPASASGVTTKLTSGIATAFASGLTIETSNAGSAARGDAVWFAIRPEKIRVSASRPAPDPAGEAVNMANGEIWDIAYLGDMTVYIVKLANGQTVKASSLNAQRSVENPLGYDEDVWISFDGDAGVLLKD